MSISLGLITWRGPQDVVVMFTMDEKKTCGEVLWTDSFRL
jgi:hypothetical protein